MSDTTLTIVHDGDANRFIAHVPGGGNALLTYTRPHPTTIDIQSVYVPSRARGQGIAAELMRAALSYAKAQGYRVVPTCTYASGFFERYPEEVEGVSS